MLKGKKALIMGVANDHSIAWGIAEALNKQGVSLAFTYQGDAFAKRVRPLAESVGGHIVGDCDVTNVDSLDKVFAKTSEIFEGEIDYFVHSVAYSDKSELKGKFLDTTKQNFLNTMDISCYSLVETVRRCVPLMSKGGSIITLSYLGAERIVPNYNVMGVAKAALEASVRYLANDLGRDGVRVNAISAGPMRTLAGSAIGSARAMYSFNATYSPLGRNMTLEDIGGAGVFLLSDLSSGVTGETLYVDAGYHNIGVPDLTRETKEG